MCGDVIDSVAAVKGSCRGGSRWEDGVCVMIVKGKTSDEVEERVADFIQDQSRALHQVHQAAASG